MNEDITNLKKTKADKKEVEKLRSEYAKKADKDTVEELDDRLKDMEETFGNQLSDIDKRLTKLEERRSNNVEMPCENNIPNDTVDMLIEAKLREQSEELKEWEQRQNNLILFHLAECPDNMTTDQKIQSDTDHFLQIAKSICKVDITSLDVEKIFRLGKKDGNCSRPLLVKLNDLGTKKKNIFKPAKIKRSSRPI